jgi:hypothetical protein
MEEGQGGDLVQIHARSSTSMRQSRIDSLTRLSDSAKCAGGLPTDMYAGETFVSYATQKAEGADLDEGLSYYLLKPIHYILFGNGENRYLFVPVLHAILLCTLYALEWSKNSLSAEDAPVGQVILVNGGFFTYILLSAQSIYFGALFCRQKQLTVVLLAAAAAAPPPLRSGSESSKQRGSQQHYLNVLNYLYFGSILFALIACMPYILIAGSSFNGAEFLPVVAIVAPFGTLLLLGIYLIVGSLWLWTVYVMYRTFNDNVLPNLALDALDNCEELVVSYTDSLKRVSRDWKALHIIRTISATFSGAYLAFEAAYALRSLKYLTFYPQLRSYLFNAGLFSGLCAAGYFGSLWFSFFLAGFCNDHVTKMLSLRIGDMLLNVDAYYKLPGNPNKMPLEEAKELLRNLVAIIPSRNIGLEVGGLTIGVQKAITLGSIFGYLISQFISSTGLPPS